MSIFLSDRKNKMKLNKTVKGTGKPAERLAGGVGAVASRTDQLNELQRSVLACMLWEDIAYEGGETVAARIARLVPQVKPLDVAELALAARSEQNLRHVPLLLAREMARHETHKPFVAATLNSVIQRPDELTEFLSIYWKDGKQMLSNQAKKGLGLAFQKFDEYQLAKYNKDQSIKLRDVLFLSHAKPVDKAQGKLWKKLIGGYCAVCWQRQDKHKAKHAFVEAKLATPDTWEVSLSATEGENKKEAWERLLATPNKMGAMALIRNLANFERAGVERSFVREALKNCNPEKVLPFRFITAVKHAPSYQADLENLMLRAIEGKKILKGRTIVLIDVSGSMGARLSGKSEMSRMECGASLSILLRELCEDVAFYATGGNDSTVVHKTELVPSHRGFALRDAILQSAGRLGGGGIFLNQCMDYTFKAEKKADRVIVITDEQDTGKVDPNTANAWGKRNYIINISVEKGGIAYKKFEHINGFSERVFDYIAALEKLKN